MIDNFITQKKQIVIGQNCRIKRYLSGKDFFKFRNIIMPNMDIQSIDGWQNNFSHTIWLTDSIENLPKVLITNSHYLFLTDNIHISKFMKNKYSNDFKTETDDEILVIGMTIVKDMTINTLNKSQFT
jgi:hypothetical protein